MCSARWRFAADMNAARALLNENISLLGQARYLLQNLDDTLYTQEHSTAASSVAKHFRHVFNHYEALLKATGGKIDYETRERGTAVETDRLTAIAKANSLIEALPGLLTQLNTSNTLRVERVIRLADGKLEAAEYTSSLARELDFVHQHTVHHFAVIALIVAQHTVALPPDFGMSPSTLRFNAALTSP